MFQKIKTLYGKKRKKFRAHKSILQFVTFLKQVHQNYLLENNKYVQSI